MPVAIVVCCRDRPELFETALAAAAAARRPGDELVAVDSASVDRRVGEVARASGARLVRCERPGVSRARNAGAAASGAEVVAFTDDDCLPEPGWAAAVETALSGDPELGFVTGAVLPEKPGGRALSVVVGAAARRFRAGEDPAGMGAGANTAVRRTAFEQVGGFDEEMGPGARFPAAEDHDLFWRLLGGGWEGCYDPAAAVVHRQWRSLAALLATSFGYGVGSGALAAKVLRLEPRAGRALLVGGLWRRGLAQAGLHLRRGYEVGAAAALASAAGTAVGATRARRAPLSGDRFMPRPGRP